MLQALTENVMLKYVYTIFRLTLWNVLIKNAFISLLLRFTLDYNFN